MPKVPKINFHISEISPEKHRARSWFLPADKRKIFLQVDIIFLGVQSTQNDKATISLQYLKENVKDEVDFFSADKVSSNWYYQIRYVCDQVCPNYPK